MRFNTTLATLILLGVCQANRWAVTCNEVSRWERYSKEKSVKDRLIVLLDKSGSMKEHASQMIAGFNSFVQAFPDHRVSLVQFNAYSREFYYPNPDRYTKLRSSQYRPAGNTALHDALGCTMDRYSRERNTVLVLLTDGEDTASRVYKDTDEIKETSVFLKDVRNWHFIYAGFGGDSFTRYQQAETLFGDNPVSKGLTGPTGSKIKGVNAGVITNPLTTSGIRNSWQQIITQIRNF